MTDITMHRAERDNEEAIEWAMRILADGGAIPDPTALDRLGEHQEAFTAWTAADPERQTRYLSIVRDMLAAGDAASLTGMHSSQRQHTQKSGRRWSPMALAASLSLAVLAAAGIWWKTEGTAPSLITQSQARTPLMTQIGEVRTERLADGSSVILDTDTLLLVEITDQRRNVEIKRGRARFNVVHDAKRPFIVHGGGADITTEGGIFDITNREGLRVNPIESLLRVTFPQSAPSDQSRSVDLRPGQLLTLKAGQATDASVILVPGSEQQWVSGVKSFDNVPISEVIAEANAYSKIKIALETPALGQREIFADIDIRDIERVAQALSAFLDLDIDRSQPGSLVLTGKK